MKRGELWTGVGSGYASKPRPFLIVQDDRFCESESVSVLPVTSSDIGAPLFRIPIAATVESGLIADSFIMVDKVTAIRRTALGGRVGQASRQVMTSVDRSVATFLGLA